MLILFLSGLKLLSDDLQVSVDPRDNDRNDILCDASSACRTALDILNDLLCFDKLESGILVLHKQEVRVLPFIFDCVAMFSSQARECGVDLSVINTDDEDCSDSTLIETDFIVMDKFKMDQVLRNLISNALKFTPRGGTVTVSTAFVPNDEQMSDRLEKSDGSKLSDGLKDSSSMCSNVLMYLWNFFVHRCSTASRIYSSDRHLALDEADQRDLEAHNIKDKVTIEPLEKKDEDKNTKGSSKGDGSSVSGKLVIVVTDSGAGLSAENQKKLFKEVCSITLLKLLPQPLYGICPFLVIKS
jgi:signal transduction histidine kinase